MAGMLNDSFKTRCAIRAIILLLQAYGPLCLLVTGYLAYHCSERSCIGESPFQTYLACEALFYLGLLYFCTFYIQSPAKHPSASTSFAHLKK